jgi:hypothetical protein
MKTKNTTVGTFFKSNRKIVERDNIDTLSSQMHVGFSALVQTQLKGGGV